MPWRKGPFQTSILGGNLRSPPSPARTCSSLPTAAPTEVHLAAPTEVHSPAPTSAPTGASLAPAPTAAPAWHRRARVVGPAKATAAPSPNAWSLTTACSQQAPTKNRASPPTRRHATAGLPGRSHQRPRPPSGRPRQASAPRQCNQRPVVPSEYDVPTGAPPYGGPPAGCPHPPAFAHCYHSHGASDARPAAQHGVTAMRGGPKTTSSQPLEST